MKITIVGAGAIGGLAGAYMTRAGHDVTLVDRWAEHVEALARDGVSIDGVRGKANVPVRAVTPGALEGPLEAVLVATKSQHTIEAVRQVVPLPPIRARDWSPSATWSRSGPAPWPNASTSPSSPPIRTN